MVPRNVTNVGSPPEVARSVRRLRQFLRSASPREAIKLQHIQRLQGIQEQVEVLCALCKTLIIASQKTSQRNHALSYKVCHIYAAADCSALSIAYKSSDLHT